MRFSAFAAAIGCALVLGAATEARANGRFPAANQLVLSPSDPSLLVLRTTFGVLFSHDHGGSWDWVCEKGVGYGGVSDPALGVLGNGTVLAGTFDGLAISSDVGCSWSFAPIGKQIVDLVVRKSDPRSALAVASAYVDANDAGSIFANTVFATADNGATWGPLGAAVDPRAVLQTIEVAASDPHRVYVSGARPIASDGGGDGGSGTEGVIYASADDGAHWTPHVIAFQAGETAPFIAAVDPSDADRVYVRIKGNQGSRLVVTDDGGGAFRTVFTGTGEMLGFALSPDGSKVYIGGPADGLLVAATTDFTFAQRSKVQVQCLLSTPTALYACSNEASGFIVGESTDDGKSFRAMLHLACIRGALACPETASSAQCKADFPALQESLGGQACDGGAAVTPDGGPSTDAGTPPSVTPPAESSGCGCDASGTTSTALVGDALLLVAAATLLLRGSRRR
jgi:hypothetical protein